MYLNPKKSSEARAEIRPLELIPAAASSSTQPQDSPARGHCDPRGSQPATCDRGEVAGQQFRSARPIPALVLDAILEHHPSLRQRIAANDRAHAESERRALGGAVGGAFMFGLVVFIAILLATGGVL